MVTNVEGDEDRQLERRRRHRSGLNAETLVAALFAVTGYRILARRFRTPIGEIDLIAVKAGRVTFVEVRRLRGRHHPDVALSRAPGGRFVAVAKSKLSAARYRI